MSGNDEGQQWLVIRLDPTELSNPDADLRYAIPDTIIERTGGALRDGGFDYEGEPPIMAIFLETDSPASDLERVRAILDAEEILGNQLEGKFGLSIDVERGSDGL